MVTDYGLVGVCVCVYWGWREVDPNWLAVKAFNEEWAASSPISFEGPIRGWKEDSSSRESGGRGGEIGGWGSRVRKETEKAIRWKHRESVKVKFHTKSIPTRGTTQCYTAYFTPSNFIPFIHSVSNIAYEQLWILTGMWSILSSHWSQQKHSKIIYSYIAFMLMLMLL